MVKIYAEVVPVANDDIVVNALLEYKRDIKSINSRNKEDILEDKKVIKAINLLVRHFTCEGDPRRDD